MNTDVNRSGSRFDTLRFLRLPGPRSNSNESSTTREGQARFALTADPPEPRIVSFIGQSTFEFSFLLASLVCASLGAGKLDLTLHHSCCEISSTGL
jgi:hypothetical protein